MKRNAFRYGGKEYDLSHLDPFEWKVSCPEKVGGPQVDYKFYVSFSDHAFTSSSISRSGVGIPYSDDRDFDFQRYELSKKLPEIIKSLDSRTCFSTRHNNFFTIEITDENGVTSEYEVFFAVSKASHRGWMRLFVESAYIRDRDRMESRGRKSKIGFNVIARNTLQNRRIRRP